MDEDTDLIALTLDRAGDDPLSRRRAEIAKMCEELGFAGLAARVETAPDALGILRLSDGRLMATNDRCEQLLGYSYADHSGMTTVELRVWDDPACRDRFVADLRERGEVSEIEARLRRVDGVVVPVLLSGRMLEVRGEPLALCVAHDITQRVRTEEALRRSEEYYRSIVESMDEGLVFVDRSGAVSSINPAAMRILGHPSADLVGHSLEERLLQGRHVRVDGSPMPVEEHPAFVSLKTGETQSFRVMGVHRPDDSLVWLSVNSRALVSAGESDPNAVMSTFRDITPQVEAEAELRRRKADLEVALAERESSLALVQGLLASIVRVVGEVVEARDPYTGGHQRRVSELATRIAEHMEWPAAQVEAMRVAALIHDAGKMSVPIEILNKPGTLSALEFSLVKAHVEAGHRIVSAAQMGEDIAEIVYQHHERCDGSGYPRGLSGDALHPGAEVLMVADVVEAMSSHRPYRPALGLDAALDEIARGAGVRYDAEVCRACTAVVREPGFAFGHLPS